MSSSSEARKVTKTFERRNMLLNQACEKQIKFLWVKHSETNGKGSHLLRASLLGKIVGIQYVLDQLKQLQRNEVVD